MSHERTQLKLHREPPSDSCTHDANPNNKETKVVVRRHGALPPALSDSIPLVELCPQRRTPPIIQDREEAPGMDRRHGYVIEYLGCEEPRYALDWLAVDVAEKIIG